ncbi:hypothetical protein [Neptuniibacter sp.]|uniref:hypothetical protein n=1 Tax=Neptuniibacter sp. TaxID=1962643 RepID=UPI002623AC6E|nr:hypothetical protein [Neptuniibacter sp.]
MKKAIFLFDYTGIMAQPWLDEGYECWCFDGQHSRGITRDGNHVKVGMFFEANSKLLFAQRIASMVGPGVVFVFGFPECTDLTNAGAKHFQKKRDFNPMFHSEAIELCDLVRVVGVLCGSAWAFENPMGALSTQYRSYDFRFNPCDYGGYLPEDDAHPLYPQIYPGRDAYNKDTCIWHGNGFKEPKRKKVDPLYKENPGWKLCGGKSTKTKNIRSATPRGFAQAVFESNRQALSSSAA